MTKFFLKFVAVYVIWLLWFMLEKPVFLFLFRHLAHDCSWRHGAEVIRHGFSLDASVAGYFTVVFGLLLLLEAAWGRQATWMRYVGKGYFVCATGLFSFTFILNLVLYGYWRFPLDNTPLFYFFSSPKDALASAPWWQTGLGLLCWMLIWWLAYRSFTVWLYPKIDRSRRIFRRVTYAPSQERWKSSLLMVVLTGGLFLPIRGGITVSTMNTGHAYFSSDAVLNHAAVNPFFSLMESMARDGHFKEQYRFMSEKEAAHQFVQLQDPHLSPDSVCVAGKPNVMVVVMESFSSKLLKVTGGLPNVAVNLDSVARSNILFTNFYANSFRTDRGLVAVLSGYPAQPTMSLMKNPKKTAHLPSICATLKAVGYTPHYFYGGDADFTNMRSYLTAQGFTSILSEAAFPKELPRNKWGIDDGPLFDAVLDTLRGSMKAPFFAVVQTSSSHEPFEVPYHRLKDKRLNAFAYTDSVIGHFLRSFSALPSWKNTLVILVPDHLGAYPPDIDPLTLDRFRIPLIVTGGVVKQPQRISTIGSQQDIAATLLAALGLPTKDFTFSKNMLSKTAPHFAFFTIPDAFGMVDASGSVIYDNVAKKVVHQQPAGDTLLLHRGKAYLQSLYNDIDQR